MVILLYVLLPVLCVGNILACAWVMRLKGRTPWLAVPAGLLGPLGMAAVLTLKDQPVAPKWHRTERERREALGQALPVLWVLTLGSFLSLVFLLTRVSG